MKKVTCFSSDTNSCINIFSQGIVAFQFHQKCFKYTSHSIIYTVMLKWYILLGQGLIKSVIFTAASPRDSLWNSTLIMAKGSNLHSLKRFHHCSNPPKSPGVGGEEWGWTTWVVLQCLFLSAAQGPLEWPSSGLGASSINNKKKKQTQSQAMDQSLYFGVRGENPPFSVWTRWLLPFRAFEYALSLPDVTGRSEGFSHFTNFRYFLNQCDSKLLKMRNTWKIIHTLNNSGKECIYLIPSSKKCNFIKKTVELTWKFKLSFIFCQHIIQAITWQQFVYIISPKNF